MTSLSAPGGAVGASLRTRLALVVVAELLLAVQVWRSVAGPWTVTNLVVVPFLMFGVGLAVSVQAPRALPTAWHVLVVIGYPCTFAVVLSTLFGGPGAGFGIYWNAVAVYGVAAVELSALLALVCPRGSSYLAVRMREAPAASGSPRPSPGSPPAGRRSRR